MAMPSGIDEGGDDHELEAELEGGDDLQQEPAEGDEVEGFVMKSGNLLGAPLPPPPRPDVRPAVRKL